MIDSNSALVRNGQNALMMRSNSIDASNEKGEKASARGNMSKTSRTWMNGPMHEVRNQCIPGYTGFISGVRSENLYGKSYSNNTAKSFKGKIPRGINHEPKLRFVSQNTRVFKETNNRRIRDRPEFASKRDFLEYTATMNMNMNAETRAKNTRYMSQTGAFDKFRGTYHDQTDTTLSPKKHSRDLNGSPLSYLQNTVQLKPRLVENGLAGKEDFAKLSPRFKQIMASGDDDWSMRLPIVGYQGHRKGEKAENMFAKSYRDTAILSTRQLRQTKMLPNTTKL